MQHKKKYGEHTPVNESKAKKIQVYPRLEGLHHKVT